MTKTPAITSSVVIRCNEYAYLMAKTVGIPDVFLKRDSLQAQLHDIGKMSVNSAILTKRGRLDEDERFKMSQHTTNGHQILERSYRFQMAAEITRSRHEQWNGAGYPDELKGEQIPISARILAAADIYDALRSECAHKSTFSHEKTYKILTVGDDRLDPTAHFEPRLLEVFKTYHEEFNQIRKRLED